MRPRSLLVLNDTRVIPARLRAHKTSGGAVEVLLVRRLDGPSPPADRWSERWEVLARGLGSGAHLTFGADLRAEVIARGDRGAAELLFRGQGAPDLLALADRIGTVPLPPYIEAARKRQGDSAPIAEGEGDPVRYQTVYARAPGAVAAPTAGLHFTPALLDAIARQGHEVAHLTLHVGPGTFRPVEVDDPTSHRMDSERYEISSATAQAVNRARSEGRPVVAVGTTVVRALETAGGQVAEGVGSTDLFMIPGAEFRVVTDLITNFHLPRSTLLMLVAAFAGREPVLAAYAEAVRAGYRFYSYGDAMFIRPGDLPA